MCPVKKGRNKYLPFFLVLFVQSITLHIHPNLILYFHSFMTKDKSGTKRCQSPLHLTSQDLFTINTTLFVLVSLIFVPETYG